MIKLSKTIYKCIIKALKMKCYVTKALAYAGVSILLGTMLLPNAASAAVPSGRQIVASDFLTASDGYLKNTEGNIVALRGVNAGGWLIQESWMCPINGADRAWANLDTINAMKNRGFTDEQIQTLFNTYQNNWFTTTDLDNLKEMNVNLLRVPFWYRNFMKDENGTWITGSDLNSNPGIQKLDWVISECGKRGIYVILDLHGAPGGQSMDHCTGTLAKNELYDSSKNRQIMADLWTKIASRYKGNPIVAAYDIMNEPQNNNRYSGANSWAPGSSEALNRTFSVYDQMYKVIRSADPDHVITMEAIWDRNCLPDPAQYGWKNLMYQMHIYDTTINMIDQRVSDLKYYQSQYGVAAYAGEFNSDPNEEYVMTKFNQAGINWSTWAYKGSKQSSGSNWFLYYANLPYVDSTKDSYETILSKWGSQLKTSNFTTNELTVKNWIKNHTNDHVPATSIESGKTYKITSKYSGKALDVKDSSTLDGGNVQQWSYTGADNQLWRAELLSDGYYKLTNISSGKVLDVAGPSTIDGANVQQWTFTGGDNQKWSIIPVNGYYQIKSKYSDKVLDVKGPSAEDGANIQQWTATGADNQLFSLSLK
ncbi:RICIN domain-containing protein [Clostridium saccharoperbutylacetonicum]|uniref:RICIN domain-containing protein n=1 Tax=Clostridium saccharoperbutylacetonicum TaxID=36745 RepID=UPI000983DE83|nr:RICIN domain-containing protein [Clostridium saccharoperbutylacetonicum]AQR93159.1 extracellular exo-alpha-L-arabinofuranosidase precursor [Clostridium saccharoperbutylacetonicum]NSB34576.1 aryl-phospho-beta-D-glucosidase BglC (GH1 family) [Clostridium saccharoperbutylacetonicum]